MNLKLAIIPARDGGISGKDPGGAEKSFFRPFFIPGRAKAIYSGSDQGKRWI
jgi:hypothetical protein